MQLEIGPGYIVVHGYSKALCLVFSVASVILLFICCSEYSDGNIQWTNFVRGTSDEFVQKQFSECGRNAMVAQPLEEAYQIF